MKTLHIDADRRVILERLNKLRPDTPRKWGTMSAHQMVCHLTDAARLALGEVPAPKLSALLRPFVRWILERPVWPKSMKTTPEFLLTQPGPSFDADKATLLSYLQQIADKPLDSEWPTSAIYGRISGRKASEMMHKHVDHHLRQFGL